MKISSFSMELNSSSTHQMSENEHSNLKVWVDSPESTNQRHSASGIVLALSDEGKKLALQAKSYMESVKTNSFEKPIDEIPDEADIKQRLLSDFIYVLTGKRLKFVNIKPPNTSNTSTNVTPAANLSPEEGGNQPSWPKRVGWGINFNYQSSYKEESKVSFAADVLSKLPMAVK